MAHLIEFKTDRFDPAREPPNPVNPIPGYSILAWLREHVLPGATEPDHEDWGWYIEVEWEGSRYLVGAICHEAEDGASGPERDWALQIHRHRSVMDKMLGRNRLQPDDPLVKRVVGALRAEPSFRQVVETMEG